MPVSHPGPVSEMSEAEFFLADILIVDDNLDNIRFLSNFLSQQQYRVRKAINGQVALTAANAATPDLILLDISMPGMNGYEVCQHLKSNPQSQLVPIIFLSAANDALDKARAFQAGGVDYIEKPFQLEEVLIRIQAQLKLQKLQKELKIRDEKIEHLVADLEATRTSLELSRAESTALLQAMHELMIVLTRGTLPEHATQD